MKLGAQVERPEVRPSMESFRFDAVPDPENRPLRRGDLLRGKNRELQIKVDELEKLYAAHFKIRLSEKSLDGDLLVRMVDGPENHIKLRGAEIRKGRAYGRYAEKRDAKLSAERGWKRKEMEMLENKFEENWDQMKARRSRDDSEVKYRAQIEEEDFQEQIQMLDCQANSSSYTLPGDRSTKKIGERNLLSAGKSSSYTRFQTSTAPIPKPSPRLINSDATNGSSRTVKASTQSLPNFSHLRKENMKPPTRINKISTPLHSTPRSKSSANLSELKDLSAINSCNDADLSSSKFSKQQSLKTISRKIEGKSKAVQTRTNGDSLAELRASKAFEIQSKEDESANMINQQKISSDLVKMESIKTRPSVFHIESDTEEPRSSHESGICDAKSEKHEILKCAGEEDNSLATVAKINAYSASENKLPEESFQLSSSNIIHPSQSCVHVVSSHSDSSVHAPTSNPATWTTLHQNMMQQGDSTRVRRKWEITEKPKIASNNSDKLLKDVAKQFKKLLKFGRKGKNADNSIHTLASSSSASGGDDDTEEGHEISKLSSDDMKKCISGYSSPCYVGLHEGKFLSGQVQSPIYFLSTSPANLKFRKDNQLEGFSKATCSVLSLLPFHGSGSESKLK